MNGETYQICRLTAEMKRALKENRALTYQPLQYENQPIFHFLPPKSLVGMRKNMAYDSVEWFEELKKQGIKEVKMMMPTKVQDRNLLGFSNTSRTSIFVFLENGEVRYWVPHWEFDSKIRKWNINYTEAECADAPKEIPSFADNTQAFLEILDKIEKLADTLGFFANVFQEAKAILLKEKEPEFHENVTIRPPLPKRMEPLFNAADKADVFGAMGSWNDSPAYVANMKGLSEEYNALSSELLMQIRYAVLYAINEW